MINHFIVGANKTCMTSDSAGQLKIIGEKGRKKHKKNVLYNRDSVTMLQTGSSTGSNVPTTFLMKGKKKKRGYTDEFLVEERCTRGSTIVMTKNAFMTDKAWEVMLPKVCWLTACLVHNNILI